MNPWRTAVPDWAERIKRGDHLVPDLPLFEDEASRALKIFSRLRIPDVIGQPTMAQACGPWFFPIVQAMFGSYNPETHRRMIQEYFLLIPKKNSKSSTGGAVMLTALIMNRRPEAEFVLVAPTIEIAGISFRQAANTVKCDPELAKIFRIVDHKRTIINLRNDAALKIKAADKEVITGGKQVGTMIDETHVFASKSNAADIFLELRGSLAARPDGFLFQTTTQSKDPPAGVFKAELQQARDVRDGKKDFPLLPVLYEYPPDMVESDAWQERKYWQVVNPNMGRSVNEDFLDRELTKAREAGRAELILFASQHFNVEIGLRLGSDAWAGAAHWQTAADESLSLEELLDRSEVVTVGIDGGGVDDLQGLAVMGREKDTRHRLLWTRAWCKDLLLEERKEIAPRLEDFAKDGDLVIVPAASWDDYDDICDLIMMIYDRGLLPEKDGIGVDTAGIQGTVDAIWAAGIPQALTCAVPQGYRMNGAIQGMARALLEGSMRHSGQPMMDWCVGNAKTELRGSAVTVTKQASGKAKIDPLDAAFNAFSLMDRGPVAKGTGMQDYFRSLKGAA